MRKLFLWILFLAVAFFLSMQMSKGFQAKILYVSDAVKIGILNLNANFSNIVTRYFNQARQIKELTNSLEDKEKLQYAHDALKSEYDALMEALGSQPSSMQIKLSRTISYVEMNDYTKIWLEKRSDLKQRENAIFGLIYDDKVAGIAVAQSNRLLGYLNGNEKCSYSVAIGDEKVPGVAKYDLNKGFVVDYIPMYPKVEVGEQVVTNGMDEIFYPGILVGVVESVEEQQGYQVVSVKPAIKDAAAFYWLVDIDSQKAEPVTDENMDSKEQEPKIFDFNAQD